MSAELEEMHNPSLEVIDEDDDQPSLSLHTLEALKEFLCEQSSGAGESLGDVRLVAEDWRLSQFWYDRDTAETIAEEIRSLSSSSHSPVACIACPTIYAYLKKIDPNISVQLLEYDRRFEQYGSDYIFYDYNLPEELPLELGRAYKIIVADPPYLSKECLEKVVQTISYLAQREEYYLLLLTGEVQKESAAKLLKAYSCGFRPQHSNKLGNEFRLFTNYDPGERLGGWE
ncbi:protein-lysine N-methyltransferase n6amt2 [Phalaenopsis equestris]|uniref:protein-lysine N-methyltransferase n6amt2 n=1 Tax=Phalaenopsis equestris TaxID=78828 RepID=UPI0009E49504|nr:protein-lysine N-methyltransferase n6amt2 [Phalaenopsis equestris]